MEFIQLNRQFAEKAADLVIAKYRDTCSAHIAFKANAFTSPELAKDLVEWAEAGASVVAHQDGLVQGFIAGRFIDFYKSKKTFYSPEWLHAVGDPKPDRLLNEMYAWLTRSGQLDESAVHVIGVYASDGAMKSALGNLEFGVHMMDGVLTIPSMLNGMKMAGGFTVRAAESSDVPSIIELDKQLWLHLSQPPISLNLDLADYPEDNPKYRLPRDGSYISVAEIDRRIIGFISCQLGVQESRGLRDPSIPAINGAFVDINHRDADVGQALLDDIYRHARELSAPYVTVDFESTNVEGSGFWRSRQFTPLAYGMIRRIPT